MIKRVLLQSFCSFHTKSLKLLILTSHDYHLNQKSQNMRSPYIELRVFFNEFSLVQNQLGWTHDMLWFSLHGGVGSGCGFKIWYQTFCKTWFDSVYIINAQWFTHEAWSARQFFFIPKMISPHNFLQDVYFCQYFDPWLKIH